MNRLACRLFALCAIATLCWSCTPPALASYGVQWVRSGNLFARWDGVSYDGWYYQRTSDCYGRTRFVRFQPFATNYAVASCPPAYSAPACPPVQQSHCNQSRGYGSSSYSGKDWREQVLEMAREQQERREFQEAIRALSSGIHGGYAGSTPVGY